MSGVAFNPPPMHLIQDVQRSIDTAIKQLPPDANGGLVAIATEHGVNAAVVAKLDHGWTVTSWIGKAWSEPISGGASVMKVW